jgi:hypothetical protein
VTVLEELIEALERAAAQLEQGNAYERAWARHWQSDARQALLLRQTWREPDELATPMGRTEQ